jgi:hypothetical protein
MNAISMTNLWQDHRPTAGGAGSLAPPSSARGETCDALVLLAGVVRPTEWHEAIRRPLLDLPVDQEQSLLDLWHAQAIGLARGFAADGLTVRVRLDPTSPVPTQHHLRHDRVRIAVDRDEPAWRGSGGVLRDIAADYPDEARVVAVHAAQVPLVGLRSVVADLSRTGADAALVTPPDGEVCGSVMWLRCACLRELPAVGYCDFHEQALPVIARQFATRAVPLASPIGLSVRTRASYLQALRRYHRMRQGVAGGGPFAEDWKPAFGITEQGSDVHPTAQVMDSVVLRGGRVDRGAVLIRSVVCPGGVVRRGRVVIDEVVGAAR